jgi:hypothetical protein
MVGFFFVLLKKIKAVTVNLLYFIINKHLTSEAGMKRTSICCLVVTLFTFILSGCSSTTLTGSWRSPEQINTVKKVYIVGVSKQETSRRSFEDGFGQKLQAHGVETVSSYKDLKNNQEASLELITEKVKANGADALLLTRVLSQRTEAVVNPGRVSGYSSPSHYGRGGYRPEPYYRNYRSYYDRRYEMTYEPATISQFSVVTMESNLYDSASGELIWSAQLETVLDSTLQKLIRDFIEVVTKDLLDQGVI